MSTTPIGNSDYLRVWDNTGNNLNPSPSGSIIDNGFLPDTKTDSSILNYTINILGQKVNQSLAYGSPQWSANNAYRVGSTVNNSGNVYISKVDSNLNHPPSSSPTQWDLIATAPFVANTYAPLNSPHLTGIPIAPTANVGTNTTQLATTAFVKGETDRALPAGSIITVAAETATPAGYFKCNGAEVNRTIYATLFAKIGTLYGGGDGTATFNLPDFRGAFLRGSGGASPNISETIGTAQGDAIRNITGNFNSFNSQSGVFVRGADTGGLQGGSITTHLVIFDASRVVPTAGENRPYNFAVDYYIKY